MSTINFRKGVFISYSHRDRKWLDKLQTVLEPLVRSEGIDIWDDTRIQPGSDWRPQIAQAIAQARVAILLVSANFLASDFIVDEELPLIWEARKDGLTILWVAVSASLYDKTALKDIQAANDPSKPLDTLSRPQQQQALVDIAKKIDQAMTTNSAFTALKLADWLGPQVQAFQANQPEPTAIPAYGVQAVQRQGDAALRLESRGAQPQVLETITAADFEKLDAASLQLIRAYETEMEILSGRWSSLAAGRADADTRVRDAARAESALILRDLCANLNKVLDYLDFLGKHLQDHYGHIRYLCQGMGT
jgi:hypothetical protein